MKNFPLIFIFIILIVIIGFAVITQNSLKTIFPTTPTPTSALQGTPVLPNTESVNLYFVSLEDNGQQGQMIGCNDSLVPVITEISSQGDQIRSTLELLLSVDEQTYPDTDLYNSLYQSNLSVESVSVEGSVAEVRLSGELVAGGVCDNPRIENQLTQTVLQFQNVSEVNIYINDEPLSDVLSLQ